MRLKGQEAGIQHGYYTMFRTYTVWYRDINNSLLADVVVNPLTYTISEGGTTRTDLAGANAGTSGSGTAAGTAAGGTTVNLGAGGGQNVLTDANGQGAAALDGEGQDANSERIDDNETPLASGTESERSLVSSPAAIAGIVAAALLAVLIAFLLVRRRRKQDDGKAAEK